MRMNTLKTLGIVAAVLLPVSALAQPIDIGSRLEPMVDDYLIESFDGGAELILHHPVAEDVAIVHDAPWEGNTSCYHTVFEDDGTYRMYYRGQHYDVETKSTTHREVVCYAESKDGKHFTKPDLGIVEFDGSKANNIIWDGIGSHNFAPFKDQNPDAASDAKYKALGRGPGGLYAFKSADAVHWELMSDEPVITKGAFDSQNLAFYDTVRGQYVDYHRGFKDGVRDIMTCTSDDFLNWTEPDWIEYPGAPKEHLYTNQITAYHRAPHIFMGFPKRFMPGRTPADHPVTGLSDGVFMTSRDGEKFHRWGEAQIRPGLQDARWVNRNNMTAWGIVETQSDIPGTPNDLSIYSTEGYYAGDAARLRRFTVRKDGFVSVNAPLDGGSFVTKPITFEGGELVINFSTSAAGTIKVEIQDADGNAIAGHAMADCPDIYGDEIAHTVEWESGSDVSDLAGKPVRLHVQLSDADLYAIQFK